MSKRNKHGWNNAVTGGVSYRYMHDELGPWISCPKKNCGGTMTDIFVRYIPNGPIFNDKECTICGKVTKDPFTYEYLKGINQANRDARKNTKKGRPKRIQTNRTLVSKMEVLTNPRLQGLLRSKAPRPQQGAVNHETQRRK